MLCQSSSPLDPKPAETNPSLSPSWPSTLSIFCSVSHPSSLHPSLFALYLSSLPFSPPLISNPPHLWLVSRKKNILCSFAIPPHSFILSLSICFFRFCQLLYLWTIQFFLIFLFPTSSILLSVLSLLTLSCFCGVCFIALLNRDFLGGQYHEHGQNVSAQIAHHLWFCFLVLGRQ